jgi:hypothetical protein
MSPGHNPVYELLVEALDCADRLTLVDGAALLHDAIERCHFLELPEWLPQFAALVKAMDGRCCCPVRILARAEAVPPALHSPPADNS